jgi:hypothetical protein
MQRWLQWWRGCQQINIEQNHKLYYRIDGSWPHCKVWCSHGLLTQFTKPHLGHGLDRPFIVADYAEPFSIPTDFPSPPCPKLVGRFLINLSWCTVGSFHRGLVVIVKVKVFQALLYAEQSQCIMHPVRSSDENLLSIAGSR